MGGIVAIGERALIQGFALAGVSVITADGADTARAAWRALPDGVGLVILTAAAHAAVATQEDLTGMASPLTAVMP